MEVEVEVEVTVVVEGELHLHFFLDLGERKVRAVLLVKGAVQKLDREAVQVVECLLARHEVEVRLARRGRGKGEVGSGKTATEAEDPRPRTMPTRTRRTSSLLVKSVLTPVAFRTPKRSSRMQIYI